MDFLKNISLRNKLIGIILAVTFVALSVGVAIFVYNAVTNLKEDWQNSMVINAKLVSEYSIGPIIFDDKNGATEILQKLDKIEGIEEAYIFDQRGAVFASYYKNIEDKTAPEYRNEEWSKYEEGYLKVYQPITYLGEQYGTICIKASTEVLTSRIFRQNLMVAALYVVILILSWVLARWMQRIISEPILALTSVTSEISGKGDYTIRAQKSSTDEIGLLYDQFNVLIQRIEEQQEVQKKNEEALKMSEEKYRNIFENSLVGIYRYNIEQDKVDEANDAAVKILRLDKVKGWKMKNMFHQLDERTRLLTMLKTEGEVNNFETRLKRGDGELIWVSISGKIYENGKYYEGVLQDITTGKQNFINLKRANFELDNFVYHTSHDLRSPLLSVLGLVNLAKSETDIQQIGVLLEMIEKSIKKLDSLVNDLLVLSRDNRINDPHETIDIETLIHDCVESYDFLKKSNDIDIVVEVVGTEPFVSDRTRVSVILNNLISNAIKYSRKDIDHPFVHISARIDEVKCVLKIEDNGEGIPQELQTKIFDMFYRATESSEGSGLGLYIVKNVIDKLGAKIDLDSVAEVGTTFSVTIPNHQNKNEEKVAARNVRV